MKRRAHSIWTTINVLLLTLALLATTACGDGPAGSEVSGIPTTTAIFAGTSTAAATTTGKNTADMAETSTTTTVTGVTTQTTAGTTVAATKVEVTTTTDGTRPTAAPYKHYVVNNYADPYVTVTLYDRDVYGLTFLVTSAPKEPTVLIAEGEIFNAKARRVIAAEFSQSGGYYTVKATVSGLQAGKTYSFRYCDAGTDKTSRTYSFTARDMQATSFRFVHLSDSQMEDSSSVPPEKTGIFLNDAFRGMAGNGFRPDFILHTGDFVQTYGSDTYLYSMLGMNQMYFSSIPMQAIAGNHDTTFYGAAGKNALLKRLHYKYPEQKTDNGVYYSFTYGNAKFIMLNANDHDGVSFSDGSKMGDEQYNWLLNELKTSKEKWVIVGIHQPVYSVGGWGEAPLAAGFKTQLGELFARYKVDLVLQGHDHTYSKTYPIGRNGAIQTDCLTTVINGIPYAEKPKGVIYAMNGAAGNQSRSPSHWSEEYEYYDSSAPSSFAQIEVTEDLLTVEVYGRVGDNTILWKSYGIKK